MATYTNLHLAIRNKLGWSDMPAKVADPAIDRIIEVSGIQDAKVLDQYLDTELFCYLGWPFNYLFEIKDFINLRWEIEQEMFHGASYQEAIDEWFK